MRGARRDLARPAAHISRSPVAIASPAITRATRSPAATAPPRARGAHRHGRPGRRCSGHTPRSRRQQAHRPTRRSPSTSVAAPKHHSKCPHSGRYSVRISDSLAHEPARECPTFERSGRWRSPDPAYAVVRTADVILRAKQRPAFHDRSGEQRDLAAATASLPPCRPRYSTTRSLRHSGWTGAGRIRQQI